MRYSRYNKKNMLKNVDLGLVPKGLITLCIVSLVFWFFPRVFYFPSPFLCFLAFLIPTCWYRKGEENQKKKREKREKIARREKMFLYYTIRWVKTQTSCVFLAFFWHFLAFLLTNLTKTHSVIWAAMSCCNDMDVCFDPGGREQFGPYLFIMKKNANILTYSCRRDY